MDFRAIQSDLKYTGFDPVKTCEEQKMEKEYHKQYQLKDKDTIKIYKLPKNRKGKLGSFSHQPISMKANSLQQAVGRLKGKLADLDVAHDLTSAEKNKRRLYLNCQLKYIETQLTLEINKLPRHYVIVEELD